MIRLLPTLILLGCCSASAGKFPLACVYVERTANADLESHSNCAVSTEDSVRISAEHLKKMSFDRSGLSVAVIDRNWYYVRPNGALLRVLTFDNGPDDFSEGLTRSSVAGKVAYYDKAFQQVVPPIYDWGWPFEKGRALVCRECRPGKVDDEGHVPIVGGKWGYIDRSGHEVVPVTLSREMALETK